MSPPDDIRLSFNEVAETYDQVRPSYPSAFFSSLFDLLPPGPEIIEVGPGTGQATKELLAGGASVHAIEIGPAMAAKLRANLGSAYLRISVGDFEELHIEPKSANAVFSACAYHWISPGAQADRPAMILQPDGVLAIIDLIQVDSLDDHGFFTAAQPIYDRYGQGRTGPPAAKRPEVDPPMRAVLEADRRFKWVEVRKYDWNQTYTASGYRKLMSSYSGTQMMDEPARSGLLDDIESLVHRDFAGVVTRPLVATLTTAVRTNRT